MKDIKVALERALDVIELYAPNHEILEQISDILASEQEPVGVVTGLSITNNPREFEWYSPVELGAKLYLHPSQDKARIAELELENKTLREAFGAYIEHCKLNSNYPSDFMLQFKQALSTPTSQDEWIKRSELELVGVENNLRDGVTTKMYHYREETK